MERYEHRQAATTIWLTMAAAVALMAVIATGLSVAVPDEDRSVVIWFIGVVIALLVLLGWLFNGLTVRIDDARIELAFGPGWPRKQIALADVRAARPVRNSWWYGWGIRLTPHGWLWNVSGLDAVELELGDGTTFRIGTDEPQRLAGAVHDALPG